MNGVERTVWITPAAQTTPAWVAVVAWLAARGSRLDGALAIRPVVKQRRGLLPWI